MSVSVCVRACLSVRDHISGTTRPIFTNFCACYLWPWLDPPLAAYSDMLRTFGFVDDVIFVQKQIGCSTSPPG